MSSLSDMESQKLDNQEQDQALQQHQEQMQQPLLQPDDLNLQQQQQLNDINPQQQQLTDEDAFQSQGMEAQPDSADTEVEFHPEMLELEEPTTPILPKERTTNPSGSSSRTRFVAAPRPPLNFARQPSAIERSRMRWGQLKNYVEAKAATSKSTRQRWDDLTRSISHNVADFFGVADSAAPDSDHSLDQWRARSRLLHSNSVLLSRRSAWASGRSRPSASSRESQRRSQSPGGHRGGRAGAADGDDSMMEMTPLQKTFAGSTVDVFDSVDAGSGGALGGGTDGESSVGGRSGGGASVWVGRQTPHPIDPFAIRHQRQVSHISTCSGSKRLLRAQPCRRRERDSVLKMTYDGIKALAQGSSTAAALTAASRRSVFVRSRSFAPATQSIGGLGEELTLDDVFFDMPSPPPSAHPYGLQPPLESISEDALSDYHPSNDIRPRSVISDPNEPFNDSVFESLPADRQPIGRDVGPSAPPSTSGSAATLGLDQVDGFVFTGRSRIADKFIAATAPDVERREFGVGLVGTWLDRDLRMSRIDSHVERQLAEITEYRPYFSYWVTFVQIVVFIFSVAVYKFTDFGFSVVDVTGQVFRTSLADETCHRTELENMWWGPRQADLIHLGAKYSPCMRDDAEVRRVLETSLEEERGTACCVRNDRSGCFQTSEPRCPTTLSTWWKFSKQNATKDRPGSVCGNDPNYCAVPSSVKPLNEWPNDVTQWPVCTELRRNMSTEEHMSCEIIGRPCCVGIHGRCIITTDKHCEFLRGFFHPELTLCAQAHCMGEVCGMLPFLDPNTPNQFYRLWTSLFVHAGLIQLLLSVGLQVLIMRDLEKLAGWFRIGIIYIVSGVAGSLASAIFLPYHVEAGPAGSQFALLACLFVEVVQSWRFLANPCWALTQLSFILAFLLVVGFLPWIDNYAHAVGFVFGFLLSFALLPYVTFNLVDKRGKKIGIGVCICASAGLLTTLFILFYVSPIRDCEWCKVFNCLPFTDTFCKSTEVNIGYGQNEL